jgi:putative phosphoesterase
VTSRHPLSEESYDFLDSLSSTFTLTIDRTEICVAHGTPWRDIQYVFPTSQRHTFERIAAYTAAQIVILGHTHLPMIAQVRRTTIINPGSVCGALSSGSQTCAVLTLPDQITHYDIRTGDALTINRITL